MLAKGVLGSHWLLLFIIILLLLLLSDTNGCPDEEHMERIQACPLPLSLEPKTPSGKKLKAAAIKVNYAQLNLAQGKQNLAIT